MALPEPSFETSRTLRHEVAASSGNVRLRKSTAHGLKVYEWAIVYQAGQLNEAQAQDIETEFHNAGGPGGAFSWTPPDGYGTSGARDVRFAEGQLAFSWQSIVSAGCTVRLIEEPQ